MSKPDCTEDLKNRIGLECNNISQNTIGNIHQEFVDCLG